MATATADPTTDINAGVQTEVGPDPESPKRKRRTFTMSDEAYDTLSASAEAQGTNRSRLVEDLIMREPLTINLSAEAHELLANAAAAFGTDPSKLTEELVNRTGAILAWQAPETTKPIPWWMFWRRNGARGATGEIRPGPILPAA